MPPTVPPRSSPLHVDLVRNGVTESRHVVHAVAVDASGATVASWGDPERPTHPRSAIKPMQALPLVESGAAAAFGLSDVELALACASHNGEPRHLESVRSWLDRIGCSEDDLECGTQAQRDGTPVGNNCSGKHAGFLTVARHLGVDPAGYIRPDHPVQQLVTAAVADCTGVSLAPERAGIDGCGIPVHPVPLRSIAVAAARFASPPAAWPAERVAAVQRLGDAMVAEPWLVAGTDRLCTDLMAAAGGDLLVKVGAEGVQLCSVRGSGAGIAVKADDGSVPASEVALGAVLAHLGAGDPGDVFEGRRRITNHAGTHVADLVVS